MNKKVLISGYIGFSNFGDDAMLEVLINHLQEKNCQITTLSANPHETKKIFGIESFFYKSPIKVLTSLFKADVLISGGGNLFQDETSFLSLFYYFFIIFAAKILNKKIIIYSQGIGPIKSRFANSLTFIAFKFADTIITRDKFSKNYLQKSGIDSSYTKDACWELPIQKYMPEKVLGIQLRAHKDLTEEFINELAIAVSNNFKGYKIKLLSMQNSTDTESLNSFLKKLKKLDNDFKIELEPYYSPKQTTDDFKSLKYLISMRLHANILALKYGINCLPVSYSSKVENLAKDFNLNYIRLSEAENIEAIVSNFKNSSKLTSDNVTPPDFNWEKIDFYIQ